MRLGLGTAQIGFHYGVTNTTGKIPDADVIELFNTAKRAGIRIIDTAQIYGDSEKRIGAVLESLNLKDFFSIVSKIKLDETFTLAEIESKVRSSLHELGVSSLHGLMIHNPDVLLKKPEMWRFLERLKAEKLVSKIGISVYEVADTEKLLEVISPDIIQIPFNFFNASFLKSGLLGKLKKKGVEIHARSLFLQGILLAEPAELPPYFSSFAGWMNEFQKSVDEYGGSRLDFNMNCGASVPEIDYFIVGVTSNVELQQIISSMNEARGKRVNFPENVPVTLSNPSQWKINGV